MQTTRQIERLWNARQYDRLVRELLAARPEFSHRLVVELSKAVPVAALALIRLDELSQGYHSLNQTLIRTILAAQEGDGGWGDPLLTALCLRALMCNRGQGIAIDRGLNYLSDLQKSEGAWPAVPIRRTAADAYVSAFVLFQLGDQEAFRTVIRFDAAVKWLAQNQASLDDDSQRLWRRASLRARVRSDRGSRVAIADRPLTCDLFGSEGPAFGAALRGGAQVVAAARA
ncbi:MAG TPA: hypothetical protein VH475_16745 [Tepidisphaeraceae bacterium]